jgi:outer membrane protein assembly factor BamB
MITKITAAKPVFYLFALLLTVTSCNQEDEDILNEEPQRTITGDPTLNSFLITSRDESVYTVDPQTGQEQEIYTFADFTDIEILAEYDNGKIFVTTDDNSVNALDPTGPAFLWDTPMLEYKFSSLGLTEPVCLDGTCYASGGFGVVVALDENSGEVKWYYSTDPGGEVDNVLNENETPIVHNNKVYVFSEAGFISDLPPYMHVLDKQTGRLEQRLELPFEVTGTPLFHNNTLYLPAGNLYAYDAETLDLKWTFEAAGVGPPSVRNGRVVVHGIPSDDTISSALYCLDAATGQPLWTLETGFDTIWSPLIVGDVVFGIYEEASSFAFRSNGRPFAVRLSDGEQIWFRDDVQVDHSPVYANGRLFFHGHAILRTDDTDQNVGLMSIDASTGEIVWLNNFFRRGFPIAPLVVAENGVFGPSYYRGN